MSGSITTTSRFFGKAPPVPPWKLIRTNYRTNGLGRFGGYRSISSSGSGGLPSPSPTGRGGRGRGRREQVDLEQRVDRPRLRIAEGADGEAQAAVALREVDALRLLGRERQRNGCRIGGRLRLAVAHALAAGRSRRRRDDVDHRLRDSQNLDVLEERHDDEGVLGLAALSRPEVNIVDDEHIDVVAGQDEAAGVLHLGDVHGDAAPTLGDDEREGAAGGRGRAAELHDLRRGD